MINVSDEFKQTMRERTNFFATAVLTLADGTERELTTEDFAFGGNSLTDGSGVEGLPLGAAICRTVQLRLANQYGPLDGVDFFGAKVRLYLTFPLSSGTEKIEMGTFTVLEPESQGETVSFSACDDMHRADRPYATQLQFPATLGAMFRDICDICGIPYSTSAFPNSDFSVTSAPGEGYTYRQVLGYIAMLAAGNARVHRDGRMEILSYDPAKAPEHDLTDWIQLTVDTDDVVITGLETTDSEGNTVLQGQEGYVLTLENPLMSGKEAQALEAIGARLIGYRCRRFSGEYIANPLVEFMDAARVKDRKGTAYTTVITDVTFAFGGKTVISNSAAPVVRRGSQYVTPAIVARQVARKLVDEERTAREAAVKALNESLEKASGMYSTAEKQPDGSTIYYLHDKPSIGESQAVMKLTGEAIGFSTDGGKTYPFGFTVTGEMVMGILRSEGVSADWIKIGDDGALSTGTEDFTTYELYPESRAYKHESTNKVLSLIINVANQLKIKGCLSAQDAAVIDLYAETLAADFLTALGIKSGPIEVFGPVTVHADPKAGLTAVGQVIADLFVGRMSHALTFSGGKYDGSADVTLTGVTQFCYILDGTIVDPVLSALGINGNMTIDTLITKLAVGTEYYIFMNSQNSTLANSLPAHGGVLQIWRREQTRGILRMFNYFDGQEYISAFVNNTDGSIKPIVWKELATTDNVIAKAGTTNVNDFAFSLTQGVVGLARLSNGASLNGWYRKNGSSGWTSTWLTVTPTSDGNAVNATFNGVAAAASRLQHVLTLNGAVNVSFDGSTGVTATIPTTFPPSKFELSAPIRSLGASENWETLHSGFYGYTTANTYLSKAYSSGVLIVVERDASSIVQINIGIASGYTIPHVAVRTKSGSKWMDWKQLSTTTVSSDPGLPGPEIMDGLSNEQIRADVDYIAAMTGVEL